MVIAVNCDCFAVSWMEDAERGEEMLRACADACKFDDADLRSRGGEVIMNVVEKYDAPDVRNRDQIVDQFEIFDVWSFN